MTLGPRASPDWGLPAPAELSSEGVWHMASGGKRQGIAWELVGVLAVLTVFVVMGLIWLGTRLGGPGPARPESLTADPTLGLPEGRDENGRPYLGIAGASHVLYVFGDFQCARTQQFAADARQLYPDYVPAGRLQVVWVNLPLLGSESQAAARAATCAAQQGKFWPLHDWLFANQATAPETGAYAERPLQAIARAAGVDMAAFQSCLTDPATDQAIAQDKAFADEHKVTTTPTLILDDQLVPNADVSALRDLLETAKETATE